jgi:hypothetical protein
MSTALADIQAQIQAQVALQRESIPTSGSIKHKDGIFTLPNGDLVKDKLTAVILDYRWQNVFFSDAYSGGGVPPKCTAIGTNPAELIPVAVEDGEDPIHPTCEGCPNNQFGSKGKGKACQNKVKMTLTTPDADENGDIFEISLPPTSVAPFTKFLEVATADEKLPFQYVVDLKSVKSGNYHKLVVEKNSDNPNVEKHWSLREKSQGMLK